MSGFLIGFDGYIDYIYRIIKKSDESATYFDTMLDFASYLEGKAPRSCALQMDNMDIRLGGNAPILARTLSSLSKDTYLIGMLGEDGVKAPFDTFDKDKAFSFASPALTYAIEFNDSKLFLAPRIRDIEDPFTFVAEKTPLLSLMEKTDLLALVNWGEIDFMHKLWSDIYENCLKPNPENKDKIVYIDPADISRHPKERVEELCSLIKKIAGKRYTILSLNGNETDLFSSILYPEGTSLQSKGQAIQSLIGLDELVIHTKEISYCITKDETASAPVNKITSPLISTGAGDNFNAAYCFYSANGTMPQKKLELANASSHYYMSHGTPVPSRKELEEYSKANLSN